MIGEADVRSGRALVRLAARLRDGGDRLAFILDSEPDRDRFDLDAALFAPEGGVITRLAGLKQPLDFRISGDGTWQRWHGKAIARSNRHTLPDLSLATSTGQLELSGVAAPSPLFSGKLHRRPTPPMSVTP